MIRCDECTGWYHLECLNMAKPMSRKAIWHCFGCTTRSATTISPTKQVHFSTPVSSPSEPTLVPTSLTPRPSGNFYHNSSSELSLAPAPSATQSQRVYVVPRTPVVPSSSSALSDPSTPQFIRADYSPRSPLFYRSGRSRIASGTSDTNMPSSIASRGGSGWAVGDWDGHVFASTPSLIGRGSEVSMNYGECSERRVVLEEDDFGARSWRDMTTTPSRSLSTMISSSTGHNEWIVPGLTTPITSSNRSGVFGAVSKVNEGGRGVTTTASQEFLSNLHSLPLRSTVTAIGSPAPTRLNRTRALSSNRLLASPIARTAVYSTSPSVPSGTRLSSGTHLSSGIHLSSARQKSLPTDLPSPILSSPEMEQEDIGATTMTRTGSGLGIGFDGRYAGH